MLEFNKEHIGADLSLIKPKIEKAKNTGKVMLAGIVLSSELLLSGCGTNTAANEQSLANEQPIVAGQNVTATAIIMENGNAMIVDVTEINSFRFNSAAESSYMDSDKTCLLKTVSGDALLVNYESFKLIKGENSHEKAETFAQGLISENGIITCYDEVETYGKTRKLNNYP